jgi:hypothetical protein
VIHGGSHRCGVSPFPHPAPRFLYPAAGLWQLFSGYRIQGSGFSPFNAPYSRAPDKLFTEEADIIISKRNFHAIRETKNTF